MVKDINQYERIFITRFDILYKTSLNNWNVKVEHINIFFKAPDGSINDVIFN